MYYLNAFLTTVIILSLGFIPDDMISYTNVAEQDLREEPYNYLLTMSLK